AAPHRRGLGPSLSRVGREAPRQGGGRRRPSRPLRQRQLDGRRLRPQPRARHRLRPRARRDHPPRRDARRLGELRPVSRRQRVGYQAVWPVTAPEAAAAAGGAGSIDSPPPARPTSVPSGAGRAPLSGRRRSTTSPRTPVPGTGPRGFGVGAGAWVAAGAPTMALGAATAAGAGAGVTGAVGGATAGTVWPRSRATCTPGWPAWRGTIEPRPSTYASAWWPPSRAIALTTPWAISQRAVSGRVIPLRSPLFRA